MIERSKFTDYFALAQKKAEQKKKEDQPPRRGSRFERQRVSRILIIQSLFEAYHNGTSLKAVAASNSREGFKAHNHPFHPDKAFFSHLSESLCLHQDLIEDIAKPLTIKHWSLETMDSLLRCILVAGINELLHPARPTKPSVLICEYVEICKGFFDEKEARYINKALDEAHKILESRNQ